MLIGIPLAHPPSKKLMLPYYSWNYGSPPAPKTSLIAMTTPLMVKSSVLWNVNVWHWILNKRNIFHTSFHRFMEIGQGKGTLESWKSKITTQGSMALETFSLFWKLVIIYPISTTDSRAPSTTAIVKEFYMEACHYSWTLTAADFSRLIIVFLLFH